MDIILKNVKLLSGTWLNSDKKIKKPNAWITRIPTKEEGQIICREEGSRVIITRGGVLVTELVKWNSGG